MKKLLILGLFIFTWQAWAQPDAPNTEDLLCDSEPGNNATDTVASVPDENGYYSLFNGQDFTGWWQSCETGHSNDPINGAIFRVDPTEKAIYTTQRNGSGGILMTKKKFEHYELYFETWPDYGNDAGIFNRTPRGGRCYQTVLDYNGGASYGGSWGEGGFSSVDYRPFSFSGSEENVSIPGKSNGYYSNWTLITKDKNPTSYGCAASGCVQADWQRLWDFDGWNEFKLQFYGGLDNSDEQLKVKTWFRKMGSETWVPVGIDTTFNSENIPAGYIGIQVHGNGRFGAPRGSWYRNIRWTPLTNKGERIVQPGIVGCMDPLYEEFNSEATIPNQELCMNLPVAEPTLANNKIEFQQNFPAVSIHMKGTHVVKLIKPNGSVITNKKLFGFSKYQAQAKSLKDGVYILQASTSEGKFTKKYIIK